MANKPCCNQNKIADDHQYRSEQQYLTPGQIRRANKRKNNPCVHQDQMKKHNLSMEEIVKEFSSYVSEELDDYYNYVSNREYQIHLGEMFSDYMRSEYEILEENNE